MKASTISQSAEEQVSAKNQSTVFKDRNEQFIAVSLAIPEWAAIALTSSDALKGNTPADKIAALIYNQVNADGFYCLEEPTLDESLDYYEEMTACNGNKEIPIEGSDQLREDSGVAFTINH